MEFIVQIGVKKKNNLYEKSEKRKRSVGKVQSVCLSIFSVTRLVTWEILLKYQKCKTMQRIWQKG